MLLLWALVWIPSENAFFASDLLKTKSARNCHQIFFLRFRPGISLQLWTWILHQDNEQHYYNLKGLVSRKLMDFDSRVLALKVRKCEHILLVEWNISNKVFIDSFLPVEKPVSWICVTFQQSTEYSWWGEKAENCNCYWQFVTVRAQVFLELFCDIAPLAQL